MSEEKPPESCESELVYTSIAAHLMSLGIPFREIDHEPTPTSEDSARARGEPLGVGAKAILLRTDDRFALFVMPADTRIDSGGVRRELGVRRTRFATPQELRDLTGLVPGSVPPFGEPILPFVLFADTLVGVRYDRVAFNAGLLTRSILMSAEDWERAAKPRRFRFARGLDAPEEADPS